MKNIEQEKQWSSINKKLNLLEYEATITTTTIYTDCGLHLVLNTAFIKQLTSRQVNIKYNVTN